MNRIVILLTLLNLNLFAQNYELSGKVVDCYSKFPLANISIQLIGSDGTSIYQTTDSSGYYCFPEGKVLKNRSYIISALNSHGAGMYLNSPERKKLLPADSLSYNFKIDFCLQKNLCISYLPTALFSKGNSSEFTFKESYDDLKSLAQWLTDNPNLVLEIRGHSDTAEKNKLALSKKRASLIKNRLTKMGIPSDRLIVKGYSDLKPFYDHNENGDEYPANKPEFNQRVDFIILRKNYIYKRERTEDRNISVPEE